MFVGRVVWVRIALSSQALVSLGMDLRIWGGGAPPRQPGPGPGCQCVTRGGAAGCSASGAGGPAASGLRPVRLVGVVGSLTAERFVPVWLS